MKRFTFLVLFLLASIFELAAQSSVQTEFDTLTVAEVEQMAGMSVDSIRLFADAGDATAQFYLGVYYDQTPFTDLTKARYWYEKADAQGDADAAFYLGCMYDVGRGVPKDNHRAFGYYQKSAENDQVLAANNLAWCYALGQGVKQDFAAAAPWAQKAADAGIPAAQRLLGVLYTSGYGLSRDSAEAFRWTYRAARQDDAQAALNLAAMLAGGIGCERNLSLAREWALKAQAAQVEGSNEMLEAIDESIAGEKRLEKFGVTPEQVKKMTDAESVKLLQKMAAAGDVEAQYSLASGYYGGHWGMKKDYKKARYWYREAAKNGSEEAKRALKELGW